MKRFPPPARQRSHVTRRGALFHYYMMYLFLTSVLLTLAGTCIHTILKAERVDSEAAVYLRTLLRLEGDLRQDASRSTTVVGGDASITFSGINHQSPIRWTLADNVAKRETIVDGAATTSDRFVFQRGTELQFSIQEQQVMLTVQEPSVTPLNTAGGDTTSLAKSVQILIVLASADDAATIGLPGDSTEQTEGDAS